MPQTNQDLRARYLPNGIDPVYDGRYPTGQRPYFTVAGTVAHGSNVTITAHNVSLGTKSRQTPLLWETFQGGTEGQFVQDYDSNWTMYVGPQSQGAKITSAEARYQGAKSAFNDAAHGFSSNHKKFTPARKLFHSYWVKVTSRTRDVGSATGSTANTLVDTTKNWTANQFAGMVLDITSGRGFGIYPHVIASNTSNSVVLAENWWNWVRVTDITSSSSTSNSVGTGAKTFAISASLAVKVGETVKLTDKTLSSRWMSGTVTSYSGTSLVMNVVTTSGSGTNANWAFTTVRPTNMDVGVVGGDYWITNNDPAAESGTPVYGSTGTINPGQYIRVRATGSNTSATATVSSGGITYATVTINVPDSTTVYKLTPSLQLKLGRLTASAESGGSYSGDGLGLSPNYNGWGTHAISSWHFENADNSETYLLPAQGNPPYYYVNNPLNQWFKVEYTVYLSDPGVANGYFKAKIVGQSGGEAEVTGLMNRQSQHANLFIDEFLLGTMFANIVTTDLKAYNSDIYTQDGWSRIVIGNQPLFADCTIREEQPFSAWNNASVNATLNIAAITGPKYMFFIDENQVATEGTYVGG